MSSGSRDLASEFVDEFYSEDDIFSTPILDGDSVAEFGIGDGASGVSPLSAVLQWKECERLEALEAFLDDDSGTAEGMGVLAEAARETSGLQRACMQFSSVPEESRPNTGGLVAPLGRDAPALPFISFRRRANPVKRRRAPGRSLPNVAPRAAPGTRPRRRKPRAIAPNTTRIFEHRPAAGAQASGAATTITVEDLPTMFKHPFDASITPVMYSLNSAHEPQAESPIRARCQAFSAPTIDSTCVTVPSPNRPVPSPNRPVQEAQIPTAVDSPFRLLPLSLKDLEGHLTSSDQLSFDQTVVMSSAYGDHAHDEAFLDPMDIVMNADLGCQVDFYDPSSTNFTAHSPAQIYLPVSGGSEQLPVMGVHHGQAPGADMEDPIHISSSSASSDCAILEKDLWEAMDSISSPAKRVSEPAALADPEVHSKPRLTWTPELIHKFESAIALLGGPDKATPKAILRCMAVPGVNILNIKSRLQKFRLQAGIPPGDNSRGTNRDHAAAPRATRSKKNPAFDADTILNEVYETCRDWSDRLEAQNLHMRHLLALHYSQTEAARHNAMILEAYAAGRL